MESNERECPFCAEIIKAKAKLCRFCNRDVEPVVNTESAAAAPLSAAPLNAGPVAADPVAAVAPLSASEEVVAVISGGGQANAEAQPAAAGAVSAPSPNAQAAAAMPPLSAPERGASAGSKDGAGCQSGFNQAPPPADKTRQPPVKVMWVCIFIAWACILCPVPMSSAAIAAPLVIVKIILASAFDFASVIMAIICLARSRIFHGVLGLVAATLGTAIVYLLGFFVLVGTGMSAIHASASRPASRAFASPARAMEAPSPPARGGSGAGSPSASNSASAPPPRPNARETVKSILERANMLYGQKEYNRALPLYRQAAEAGSVDAQFNLGIMYDNGEGVGQDRAQAFQWFRKAAEQGHANAQANLGIMYDNGAGVGRDDAQAVQWYRKAAEQGHADAQANLGFMYSNGEGVGRDDAQAVQWFRKAAEQGNARAQEFLKNR